MIRKSKPRYFLKNDKLHELFQFVARAVNTFFSVCCIYESKIFDRGKCQHKTIFKLNLNML